MNYTKPAPALIERYTNGHCMDLAWALNERFGYPISYVLYDRRCPYLAHVWVQMPDGTCLDIEGTHHEQEMLAWGYADTAVRGLDRDDLDKIVCAYSHNQQAMSREEIQKARTVVQKYFVQEGVKV